MAESNGYLNPEVLGRISRLGLKARRVVEGSISGQHRSPLHGVSVEFADYREYTPGDDLKNLDWRVYGRTDRFVIKRYEEETNLRATLLIDASRSMEYAGRDARPNSKKGSPSKFDVAATIGASLATLLMKQRDAVGLVTFDSAVRTMLRPSAKQAQKMTLLETLNATRPGGDTELGPIVAEIAERIHQRGMVILVSDLLADLDALYDGIGKLQHFGHEVIVIQVLHRDEVELPFDDSILFRDIEGSEEVQAEPRAFRKVYRQAMRGFMDDVRQRCQYCGVDHLLVYTDEDLGMALSHYLHGRLRSAGPKHHGRMSSLTKPHDNPAEAEVAP